jgi:hypothetical protein
LLKGLGLVAVAVVSGLLWWVIQQPSASAPVAQAPVREYTFVATDGPIASTDCAGKSTAEVKKFFGSHPCQLLTRSLYTTTTPSGARALVSVSLVVMPSTDQAQALKALVDADNTGNVMDLVRDGTVKMPGSPKLVDGKYESRLSGAQVTLVLASLYDGRQDAPALARLATEALDLPQSNH